MSNCPIESRPHLPQGSEYVSVVGEVKKMNLSTFLPNVTIIIPISNTVSLREFNRNRGCVDTIFYNFPFVIPYCNFRIFYYKGFSIC